MDEHINIYFEDAFDFLQNAEEALLRLEEGYSQDDINQLFRSAHSLKSSSASVGFDEIASLTHKTEDMLDLLRKGSLKLDKYIINLCFEAFDTTKKFVCIRADSPGEGLPKDMADFSKEIEAEISKLLKDKHEKIEHKEISMNFHKDHEIYNNTFFVYLVFEKDTPMLNVRRFMLLNAINDMGAVLYSSPSHQVMVDISSEDSNKTYQSIISTNRNEDELLQLLDVGDVKMIKIINVTGEFIEESEIRFKSKDINFFDTFFNNFKAIANLVFNFSKDTGFHELNSSQTIQWLYKVLEGTLEEFRFHIDTRRLVKFKEDIFVLIEILAHYLEYPNYASDNTIALLQKVYIDIIREIYELIENNIVFRKIKLHAKSQISSLHEVTCRIDKNVFKNIIIDISEIDMIEPEDIKTFITINRDLTDDNIGFFLINNGIYRKRIYNILDSINDIEPFKIYYSEVEAIMGFNWGSRRKHFRMEG
ncbi:MAG TPA: Hpt domain-containing protein [Pseudobacteroides sp.]|uniref:Hpt domain-containing protein n=1 Tax=Pseudobacteroides sp. TaxID=1968840 RepID=UPI002F955164